MLVEIYVQSQSGDYELLELFDDENINIKFILKDSSDLSKIYSTYSQTFTIPGYGRNRDILRYYFDTQVTRSSNRYLKSKIYINKDLFKIGLISINEGKMKMGRSSSYVINFFTSLTNLKELFGDETLTQTLKDNPYNIQWSDGRAYLYSQNRVTAPTFDPDVIVPLVSNKRVWTYESGAGGVNNIRYTGSDTRVKHIEVQELKPAIPFSKIMDSISISKGLTFNSPLFGQDVYERLYVWCNKTPEQEYERQYIKTTPTTFGSISPWTISGTIGDDYFTIGYSGDYITNNRSNIEFNIIPIPIYNTDDDIVMSVRWFNYTTGDTLLIEQMYLYDFGYGSDNYQSKFIFNADILGISPTTPFKIGVELRSNVPIRSVDSNFTFRHSTGYKRYEHSIVDIYINLFKALPQIKTVDFISSFVKMFNISIIEDQENSNTLNFIPRSTFYNETIDYTKYIDIENYSIKPTNLYKNINFKHQTSKYKSNIDFKLGIGDREYGELKFRSNDVFLKDEYKIETQFNIVPNRLISNTNIQTFYGFLNESEDNVDYGQLWKPNTEDFTIFYYNGSQQLKDIDNNNISLNFKIGDVGTTIIEDLNTYNKVSIVYSDDPDTYVNSLGYQVEVELSDSSFIFEKNLFSNYYSDEISRIYNQNSRLFEYECILPTREINRFSLDKLIIIGDRKFTIEQADINIKNGRTKLTLMNISPKTTSSIIYLTSPTIFTATLL